MALIFFMPILANNDQYLLSTRVSYVDLYVASEVL